MRLLFLHVHPESSALVHTLPEESGQFRLLRDAYLAHLKGSVALMILAFSD
jgi:hypothetical protein